MNPKCKLLGVMLLGGVTMSAQEVTPLNLAPFVAPSQFDHVGAPWLLPKGRHVMGGIPWQIDGVVELWGSQATRFTKAARLNVTEIPVRTNFALLHLLAGTSWYAADGTSIARLRLRYTDGTTAEIPIRYAHQVRDWFGARYAQEEPLLEPATRVVWRAKHAHAASLDRNMRLYASILTNPEPGRIVRCLDLESTSTTAGLMLLALTLGGKEVPTLADTWSVPENLKPGAFPREGKSIPLNGVVSDETGKPLAGVKVRVIGVRKLGSDATDQGASHPAIGQNVLTDSSGRFSLTNSTDNRTFEVIAVADGFEPGGYLGADPARGDIELRLKPRESAAPAGPFVRIRLVDESGQPVIGARVEPNGVAANQTRRFGGVQGFPAQTLSDGRGELILSRQEPFDAVGVDITASGLAPARVWASTTNGVQTIQLGKGGQITGRVLKDGRPLTGGRVGVSGVDRGAEIFAGHFETDVDAEGRFTFAHLPTNTSWWLYGLIGSFKQHGALPARSIATTGHGSVTDAGDLAVRPAMVVAGRVVTDTRQPIPAEITVTLGFSDAWDSQSTRVGPDGAFRFEGIGVGVVEMSARSARWRLSGRNRSLDHRNPFRLQGLIETDTTNLVLEIQPSPAGVRGSGGGTGNGMLPNQDEPRNRPLRGVEESGIPDILVSGSVLDEDTGKPIMEFEILPGRKPPVGPRPQNNPSLVRSLLGSRDQGVPFNERPFWFLGGEMPFTNGSFSLPFEPLTSTPIVRVSATGYLPVETEPIAASTNLVIRLSKGRGPEGTVLRPDGQPANGATLIYAAAGEQFSLQADGTMRAYGAPQNQQQSGVDGTFAFAPRLNGRTLYVSHPSGWAQLSERVLGPKLRVRLQPWSSVHGVLVDTNGAPVSGEQLRLGVEFDAQLRDPMINFQQMVKTDAQGHFAFTNTPPGALLLNRMIPMPGTGPARGAYTMKLQTRLVAEPGQRNDLGNVTLDTPPPESLWKELKRKLGL